VKYSRAKTSASYSFVLYCIIPIHIYQIILMPSCTFLHPHLIHQQCQTVTPLQFLLSHTVPSKCPAQLSPPTQPNAAILLDNKTLQRLFTARISICKLCVGFEGVLNSKVRAEERQGVTTKLQLINISYLYNSVTDCPVSVSISIYYRQYIDCQLL